MSVTQYSKLRSDKARIERLAEELARWETNLRSHPLREGRTMTFAEAQEWKRDAQLDMIADLKDMIAR